jgi:hypothetical protein
MPTMRAFGRVEDLELAFASADRPALVTALLARCGAPGDAAQWQAQRVGTRIAALARLLAASGDGAALPVSLRCPEPSCGEPFDIAIAFAALVEDDATPDAIAVTLADGRHATLRRPTGDDLQAWRGAAWSSRQDAVATMLAALCVDGNVGPDDEDAVAEALAAHDPLVAFTVSCACPSCGVAHDQPVDVEGVALARLAARQRAMLREIHALASAYGWSEAAILAIAPERRARYLDLIEGLP